MFWAFMYWYFFGGGAGAIEAGALTPATVEALSDRVAEIEAVLDELNHDWQRGQERALDLRYELRDRLTREEWAALFSSD